VNLWSKIVEFATACAVALVILAAPGLAIAFAIPFLALAVFYLLARFALPSFLAVLIKLLQRSVGHIPGTVRGKSVSQSPGAAVRDMLYVFGLVVSAEAGLKWATSFLTSRQAVWLAPWKPLMTYTPYLVYSVVLTYLYWHLLRTERHTHMSSNQNVRCRFVHGPPERIVVGLAILCVVSLLVLKVTTGETLADKIVSSWSQAERLLDLKPAFHVLEDEKAANGKTYACVAFDFDPRKWQYPLAVEARLKNTGAPPEYVLGRMEARDSDGNKMTEVGEHTSDMTRDVERQLIFEENSTRKPCSIVVRIAAKNEPQGNLLAKAKRDPGKLIAITILGWSDNHAVKR
jgi:hypothetical protein